jgi:hypothetical protein
MKWTYRFHVDSPPEAFYAHALTPETWFSYFKAYRGLEFVDPTWPEVGSSIGVRYALVGPITVQVKHTVREHERGRRILLHEEALSGLWIDRPEISLGPRDGGTDVTVKLDQTSRWLPARPLVFLIWCTNGLVAPPAMRRLKAAAEAAAVAP